MSCLEPTGWPEDAGRDRLIGDWYIYQRKGGHRTSTDDLVAAWYAIFRSPKRPERYLDLGCGIGSVLFMVCHKLRPANALGVEAQPQSVLMAKRAITELPTTESSIEVTQSDFRDLDFSDNRYELVTGSPPYFPLNTGVLPKDTQRLACRFDARGGVEAYLIAAERAMTKEGRFYLVHQTRCTERVLSAANDVGLHLGGQADFLMRADRKEPFLSVFEFSRQHVSKIHRFQCPVRDEHGEISAPYQTLRLQLGVSSPEQDGTTSRR